MTRAELPTLPDPASRPGRDELALAQASAAILAALRTLGGVFPRGQLQPRTVAALEMAETDLLGVIMRLATVRRGKE